MAVAPSGRIIIRLKTNNKTGEFEAKILGHEGNAHCSDELDEALLHDIMDANIEGFGDVAEVTDSGKTVEHYDEKRKKQTPMKFKQEEAPFPEDEEETKKQKEPEIGLGYDV